MGERNLKDLSEEFLAWGLAFRDVLQSAVGL